MSKEEKENYDEKSLCRSVGKLLIEISSGIALIPVGVRFETPWLTYCGIAVIIVSLIAYLIYANTGNRFRKNSNSEISIAKDNSAKLLTAKVKAIAFTAIFALALISVSILLYQGDKDPPIHLLDDCILIEGMYGLRVDFIDITDISIIEQSMSDIGIGAKTNGYNGFSGTLKGNFQSDSLGETLLFVQSKSAPTIRIERNGKKSVYISLRDGEATQALYGEIIERVRP